MAGIATWYGGIEFRSRLEARWAAFFDLLGWQWDYEPFDLDGYIPDFLLTNFDPKIIVEVKPSLDKAWLPKIERSGWKGEALLVATGPTDAGNWYAYSVGWLAERWDARDWAWDNGILGCAEFDDKGRRCPELAGLIHNTNSYHCRKCGGYSGGITATTLDVVGLWRKACNLTRWNPDADAVAPPPEQCCECGRFVPAADIAGFGHNKARQRVLYCQSCVNRLADEAYDAGHR